MKIVHRLLLLSCALPCLAWTEIPRGQVVEGNRLFHAGKFTDATEHYGQALVDHPDSPVLNFNMGTAHYKAGKYTEALSSFSRVQPSSEDSERTAKTAYNTGNAHYKMGVHAEEQNPQAALAAYTAALASYRRALGADPTDQDAKFNYEFVTKKIEELQDKLENQQNQQEQQNKKNNKSNNRPNRTRSKSSRSSRSSSNTPGDRQRNPLGQSRKGTPANRPRINTTRCRQTKRSLSSIRLATKNSARRSLPGKSNAELRRYEIGREEGWTGERLFPHCSWCSDFSGRLRLARRM